MNKKTRGFIAAPLIGTIIFLTAIVFIVNINKAETNNVARLASDAYHNRVTSIVELYRGDSGSMFREDLRKVIETALTSQCWSSFTVKSQATASMSKTEKKKALETARFNTCDSTLETIQSIICSNSGQVITQQCVDEKKASGLSDADAFEQCKNSDQNANNKAYGLQNWLNNINSVFFFEGIELSPTDESRRAFIQNYQAQGEAGYQNYGRICNQLISGVKMDCNAFAKNYESPNDADKFKCCSVRTTQDKTCAESGGVELPGCEAGTFYVEVTPSAVFETLPRIQADDKAGNLLVAGALSDRDQFDLLINFPILKYYDRAYTFYQNIAYKNGEPTDGPRPKDDSITGVLDGACYAGVVACANSDDAARPESFPKYYGANGPAITQGDIKIEVASQFYEDLFYPAMQKALAQDPGLKLAFEVPGDADLSCTADTNGAVTCTDKGQMVEGRLQNMIDKVNVPGGPSGVLATFFSQMKFIDPDPRFKVDKNKPNEFCWIADAQYKE